MDVTGTNNQLTSQSLVYFYVNPISGVLSVTKPLTEDGDQPDTYQVETVYLLSAENTNHKLLLMLLFNKCIELPALALVL